MILLPHPPRFPEWWISLAVPRGWRSQSQECWAPRCSGPCKSRSWGRFPRSHSSKLEVVVPGSHRHHRRRSRQGPDRKGEARDRGLLKKRGAEEAGPLAPEGRNPRPASLALTRNSTPSLEKHVNPEDSSVCTSAGRRVFCRFLALGICSLPGGRGRVKWENPPAEKFRFWKNLRMKSAKERNRTNVRNPSVFCLLRDKIR